MGVLDKFEKGIERAVNGAFARAFKSEVQPVEIASSLRRAMDDRAAIVGRGRTLVPNAFVVELGETDYARLGEYADALADELVANAREHADSSGYSFVGPVTVGFEHQEDLETGVFRVRTATVKGREQRPRPRAVPDASAGEDAPTQFGEAVSPPSGAHVPAQKRPWLDLDGHAYPLAGSVTVIGRDETVADVVLDDPGCSRKHAEIRVTADGRHLVAHLRDLGSTNGTFVDGDRTMSAPLVEGSTITVGRTRLVYRSGER